jgi:hypothetical protein
VSAALITSMVRTVGQMRGQLFSMCVLLGATGVGAPDPAGPPPPMKPFPSGCTFKPMEPSSCYTDHDDSGRYPKYAGPRALPNDPPGCGMIGKKVEGEPVCDGKLMTPEYCAQACWTWRGYTMSATATGSECWCGDSINPASVQDSEAKCTTACTGDPSKKCGGYWLINVGQLSPAGCADSDLGWMIVGLLLGGSSLYVVLGTLFNMQSKGKPAGLQALPQLELWQSVGGLVQDGVGFSMSRLQGKRGGGGGGGGRSGYSKVRSEAYGGSEKKEKKEKKDKSEKKGKKEKKESKKADSSSRAEPQQRSTAVSAGVAPSAPAASAAAAEAAAGTAAGDGGRWVHVPS